MMTGERVWEFKISEWRSFRYKEGFDITKTVDGYGKRYFFVSSRKSATGILDTEGIPDMQGLGWRGRLKGPGAGYKTEE